MFENFGSGKKNSVSILELAGWQGHLVHDGENMRALYVLDFLST